MKAGYPGKLGQGADERKEVNGMKIAPVGTVVPLLQIFKQH